MNRKLIRTTLAEVKGRPAPKERTGGESSARGSHAPHRGGSQHSSAAASAAAHAAAAAGRKKVPPLETHAEIFYYKKQMDAHTPMVIVLLDGEEVEGTIEWYDRDALKINRKTLPNIMLLKSNIKYMYKAEERDGKSESGTDS